MRQGGPGDQIACRILIACYAFARCPLPQVADIGDWRARRRERHAELLLSGLARAALSLRGGKMLLISARGILRTVC